MEKKIIKIFEEYLSIDECATILRCHPHTIRNFIKNNELNAIKLGGKKGIRIPLESFEKFIVSKKYIPTTTKTEEIIDLDVK